MKQKRAKNGRFVKEVKCLESEISKTHFYLVLSVFVAGLFLLSLLINLAMLR